METYLNEEYFDQLHHDPIQRGASWLILKTVLRCFVTIFTLFGILKFKKHSVDEDKLYRRISYIFIAYHFYIFLKFSLTAFTTYLFNLQVNSESSILYKFNCSFDHNVDFPTTSVDLQIPEFVRFIPDAKFNQQRIKDKNQNVPLQSNETGRSLIDRSKSSALDCFDGWLYFGDCLSLLYSISLVKILNILGGPYKFLGNITTLVYGFYAIAIYIMLVLFPIEQILSTTCEEFHYIRYVLNDETFLDKYYSKKDKHLKKLSNISRIKNDSPMTLGTKKGIYLRDLRCRYVFDGRQLNLNMISHHRQSSTDRFAQNFRENFNAPALPRRSSLSFKTSRKLSNYNTFTDRTAVYLSNKPIFIPTRTSDKLNEPVKTLKHSIATNIHIQPSYNVRIANQNLSKFRPYIRSQYWHKISIIAFISSIIYHFLILITIMMTINFYMHLSYNEMNNHCSANDQSKSNYLNWTIWDKLVFVETQYAIFVIGLSASLYCSYYFGSVLDLLVWSSEILQQLHLCKLLLELTEDSARLVEIINIKAPGKEPMIEAIIKHHNIEESANNLFNEFGGVKSLVDYYKYLHRPQSYRLRVREFMALKLLNKKQTVLRASHLNLNMFLDEFNETREMTSIILRRTTQIVMGYAFIVATTKSQFESGLLSLTILLCTCLSILNLYLICAALINHVCNRMYRQLHLVLCAAMVVGSNYGYLEYWFRHFKADGEERDVMSYVIYGYKVTWRRILNFNGAFSSAYFFTVK